MFYTNSAIRGSISQGGTLTMGGDVVAYGSPSDKRLKENIKPVKSALDKVSKLQGVTFDWKDKKQEYDQYGKPHKLQEWKEAFMWILIQEYHKYEKEGKIYEPKEVTDNTRISSYNLIYVSYFLVFYSSICY